MADTLIGKHILVLTAHPDDESFTAGGTIYLNNHNGGETIIACATKGEHGRSSLGQEISAEEVKKIRLEELHKAEVELGISRVHLSDFPDRELSKHKKELSLAWAKVVESVKPDIILGFGPDGYTGHLDHIVAGSVAHNLAIEFKIPYYAFSLPGGDRHMRFEDVFKSKRIHGTYIEQCNHKEPDVEIEVDSAKKYAILKLYQSQFPNLNPHHIFSEEDAEHFLRYEYFSRLEKDQI